MSYITNAICLSALLFLPSQTRALPLCLMTKDELKALPEETLKVNGRHRVQPSETTYRLAKQAGLSVDDFCYFNMDVYPNTSQPEILPAGAIVKIVSPLEAKKVTEAERTGGKYSLHEYEFLAKGKRQSDYEFGSYILCGWSIAWPEKGCGLLPNGLENLRRTVISSCFGRVDAISHEHDKPLKMNTIDEAEAEFKRLAHLDYSSPDSKWEFTCKSELIWPFGMQRKNEAWYGRPVIVLKSDGYSNNGGNGCHSFFRGFIVSIPDGEILTERDYFREDALEKLSELVGKRMSLKYDECVDDPPKVRSGKDCWITLSEQGMTWWLRPYTVFCGAVGVANVTIPWNELELFKKASDMEEK